MSAVSYVHLFYLSLVLFMLTVAPASSHEKKYCGADLVDALQYVCGDRGFYSSKQGYGKKKLKHNKGVVDECCYQSCDLNVLEKYCAPTKAPKTEKFGFHDLLQKYNRFADHEPLPDYEYY